MGYRNMMMKNFKNGISLVILLITIIVIVILAGAVIVSIMSNNPITEANKVEFKTDLTSFANELNTYNSNQIMDGIKGYTPSKLNADDDSVTYDGIEDTNKTINNIIPLLESKSKYDGLFEVVEGKLVFIGTDTNQREVAEEIGIEALIIGEPKITITAASPTVVKQGTAVTYTIEFSSSNAGLTTINLNGNIEVIHSNGTELASQPMFSGYESLTGSASSSIRSVDVTIDTADTNIFSTGAYKLRVKAGSVINENNISNTKDTTSLTNFSIDNTAPTNPGMAASPTGWTNGNVAVAITFSPDSTTRQFSTNGTDWSNYTIPVIVNTNSTTVYAKAIDTAGNQNIHSTLTVANIDKVLPTLLFGTNGGSGSTASTTVTVSDTGGSDINTSTLQYVWDTQNISTPGSGWATFVNGATITNVNTTGTYYLWIKAADNAGNNIVNKTNSFVLQSSDYSASEGVNIPKLTIGMIAKKWNGTSWITVASPDTDTTWYNYANKEWANAQTADGSMWVWIPRYEYKIPTPHISTAQTIAVNFLSNISTTATSGYTVHPAFTFGSTELTGIWVAKFEASNSSGIVKVIPNVASWRSITVNDMFNSCRAMETDSTYGWGTAGTGIDAHLMKNVEWGAVAYLSSSTYGKTGEVWMNPNSNFLTGQAGTSVSASGTTSTYAYDNATYGVNASTTGNIYGVYDMSGGVNEYVAAYVDNGNANLTTYGLSLVSAIAQYKDLYTSSGDTSSGNYSANSGKKGDAVYETSTADTGTTSWYSDYSYMPYSSYSFFIRGGVCSDATGAGVFIFDFNIGYASSTIGFRPVLVLSGAL